MPTKTSAVVLAVAILVLLAAGSATANPTPVLANPDWRYEEGYGHARPSAIWNGGDPTSLVRHIEWLAWGGERAIGVGVSTWIEPWQVTAEGTPQAAVVVAYDLGSCHGQRAYNAVEWYFPEHGEHFNPREHASVCAR